MMLLNSPQSNGTTGFWVAVLASTLASAVLATMLFSCARARGVEPRVGVATSQQPLKRSNDGPQAPYEWCYDLMGYATKGATDSKLAIATDRAADYWRDELGARRFWRTPRSDLRVEVSPIDRNAWFEPRRSSTGCVTGGQVFVSRDAVALPISQLETLLRHELGHVLGLDDSDALMEQEPLRADTAHPRSAAPAQLKRLFRRYGHPSDHGTEIPKPDMVELP